MVSPATPSAAPQRSLFTRFVFMLVIGAAFHLAAAVLGFLAILQLALAAVGGGPSPRLQAFGASLGQWFQEAVRFLTIGREEAPFPFSDWPSA